MTRVFKHRWTCASCEAVFDLETEIPLRVLARERNPAPFIATEKMALERLAAEQHARKGCRRPV